MCLKRFIGVVQVLDTSSLTLKVVIDTVRGQGYDGAMVVVIAKKHDDFEEFFEQLGLVVTIICGSCKIKYMIREMQKQRMAIEICIVQTETGRWLNQEISLVRAGDTRWGSHFRTIVSLLNLFAEVVVVFKYVKEEGSNLSNRNQTKEYYVTPRKHRTNKTNQHHCEVVIFNTVLDMQIQEFGDRFSEVGTELMKNMVAFSACDSFSSFDKAKLLKLSEIYKKDFNDSERAQHNRQLDIYYHSLLHDERFFNLKGIADLSRLLVETGKHLSFPLVYRLLKLTFVLPVATVTVEQCFSAMKFLKTDLRNRICDDFNEWISLYLDASSAIMVLIVGNGCR
ncbi:uncharacterized protein LOC111900630 [Lactuca sativa]|uniref:uncharacterized protein LOC111900630 n=1 Tax=Lactuca sativa TaxID=4236 RepID=UPI000CD8071B|nr:uncharacterized protein LOC111900630 [Lactuca sativa]